MRFDFERQTLFKIKENLETVRDVERYREIKRVIFEKHLETMEGKAMGDIERH